MNQNPVQLAFDNIDKQLVACGWFIQDKLKINLNAAAGITIRKYQVIVETADYGLFVDTKNFGEQTEGKMITNVLNNDNRKFIDLYGIPNQTLNHSI